MCIRDRHKADAANDAGGDGVDDGLKLGAEAQDHSHHSGNADDERIVDAAQGQNTGVLTVGCLLYTSSWVSCSKPSSPAMITSLMLPTVPMLRAAATCRSKK